MRRQTETKKPERLINRIELLYKLRQGFTKDGLYRVPISWPTLDKRIARGLFPCPHKVGIKWMWNESEVEDFIAGAWTAPRREKVEA
jgi:predicted DNA-binding transcriptional regulator AlpA